MGTWAGEAGPEADAAGTAGGRGVSTPSGFEFTVANFQISAPDQTKSASVGSETRVLDGLRGRARRGGGPGQAEVPRGVRLPSRCLPAGQEVGRGLLGPSGESLSRPPGHTGGRGLQPGHHGTHPVMPLPLPASELFLLFPRLALAR